MDEVPGAALAVLFGASTFAPFTDDDTINGTVTAGILQVDLADVGSTPSEDSITFDTAEVAARNGAAAGDGWLTAAR